MVARYWFEELAGIACRVEIASEFRYRKFFVPEDCLFVTISQSGETADTLAALKLAKELGYMASLSICNVPGSSMVRESDIAMMTRQGRDWCGIHQSIYHPVDSIVDAGDGHWPSYGYDPGQESSVVSALRNLPHIPKHPGAE